MKRLPAGSQFFWILLLISAAAEVLSVVLAASAPEYDLLHVPFASWFIFLLNALILILAGSVFYWRRQFYRTQEELARPDLEREPGEGHIPLVEFERPLPQAEFSAVIQTLFKDRRNVSYLCVEPLPGGYGENTTVLVRAKSERDGDFLPRPWVVKVGKERNVEVERIKYNNYVHPYLTQKPSLFNYARWGDLVGIAYDLAQIDPESTLESFQQFYMEQPSERVSKVISEIYAPLDKSWYRAGRIEYSNLYEEYSRLSRKKDKIVEHLGRIVDRDDPYHDNLFAIEEDRRTDLEPAFCSGMDLRWYDPVALLKQWPSLEWKANLYRSIVHGDLNARNVLVEMTQGTPKFIWFIDFSHTGNGLSTEPASPVKRDSPIDPARGHTLRDFSRMEADIKFVLTCLRDGNDLKQAIALEKALLKGGLALSPLPDETVTGRSFLKAWQTIRQIRLLATRYLNDKQDLRPYYFSLLHTTLPIVYYQARQFEDADCERWQKRYALISAGMLSSELR